MANLDDMTVTAADLRYLTPDECAELDALLMEDARQQTTILDLMSDERWLGRAFASGDWSAWRAFLAAVFGLPMDAAQHEIFRAHTGRQTVPTAPASEAWMVVGRRGGKSRIAALIAVYLACCRDYRPYLAAGEVATIPIIAADRDEARTVMRYVKAFLGSRALRGHIVRQLSESVELAGSVQIEVHTARYRAVRGYTLAGAICDEIAFWDSSESSANPDREVLAALRPGMASIPGALLCGLSSPYGRAGVLWEQYDKHYGHDGDPVLVWQADTRSMNPTIDPKLIEDAYRDDPDAAAAEYGGQFRRDVEAFVSREAVRDAVISQRDVLPPLAEHRYVAFVDPSGGAVDSMTLAIAHAEGGNAVLDCLLEVRPPFSPAAVVRECADLLRRYAMYQVTGDRYGGEWPREQFRALGIDYRIAEKAKSDIYVEFLSAMNSRKVQLLDNHVLVSQLLHLERHRGRSGRDIVDHPPKGHDDVINAAAGALQLAIAPAMQTTVSRLMV